MYGIMSPLCLLKNNKESQMEALQVVAGYVLFIILGQFLKLIGRLPKESAAQ